MALLKKVALLLLTSKKRGQAQGGCLVGFDCLMEIRTGQLSVITFFLQFLGSVARFLTTLQLLGKDPLSPLGDEFTDSMLVVLGGKLAGGLWGWYVFFGLAQNEQEPPAGFWGACFFLSSWGIFVGITFVIYKA